MTNLQIYDLEGTLDINSNRKDKSYQSPDTWPTYQEDFTQLKKDILWWHQNKESKVIIRVYDGEFLFLQGKKLWNIPKRHVSRELDPKFIKQFYDNCLKCDIFCSHLTVLPQGKMYDLYTSVFGNKKIDYPMEFFYALVINKWIFKNFKNKIGLIAGQEKIKIIRELMKKVKYRNYLGIDYFTDYISVPEKFSCDNPDLLSQNIQKQLQDSKSDIFLYGMGISKMAVAYQFKEFHPAIYLDIGIAMAGLAGFLTKNRPYAAHWTNFRIRNYDYRNIDPMDVGKNENIVYL